MKIKPISNNIKILNKEFDKLSVSHEGKSIMLEKAESKFYIIKELPLKLGLIIKEEMLSIGGDFALPKNIFDLTFEEKVSGILLGTVKIYKKLIKKLEYQAFKKLRELSETLRKEIETPKKEFWVCRNIKLKLNKTLIMGILNTTPDSFYDGGKYNELDKIKIRIEEMIKNGADIIDVGGESTRPGAKKVDFKEEISRVLPAVKYIKKNYDIPVSIDTYKSVVAQESLKEGADIVNDISGMQFDKNMFETVKQTKAGVVIMHIKGTPENMQTNPVYEDVIEEIYGFLKNTTNEAIKNGIEEERIAIDPGIGFGKKMKHNFTIIDRLEEFTKLNYPVMVGLSNKSLIRDYLNLDVSDRLSSTLSLNTLSVLNGANIIRVHNVLENFRAIRMIEGVKQYEI